MQTDRKDVKEEEDGTTRRQREEETMPSNDAGGGSEAGRRKKASDGASKEKVGFLRLFVFADWTDVALMAMGAMGAVANGMAMPLMTYIFGDLINAFGITDRSSIVHQVSKVVLRFVYLACGVAVAAFLQVSCWMVTGERQSARIRSLYLKTILRQDIEFFDNETTTGEVIGRMSGDTILIQDAMGEKVGKFIQLSATFLGGFVMAFSRGWLLSLVLISSMCLVIVAGAAVSLIMSRLSTGSQSAYAEAGTIVEQTVGSIRTVASFTGEKKAIEKYNRLITIAYKAAVHQGTATGIGIGCVLFTLFSTYGLAVWYGSKLIIEKGYNGGIVFNVMVSIFTGGMSLGQTSPCLNAFSAGQAAAYKMFQTIKRKPLIDSCDTKGAILEDMKGEIELRDVYFSYPARPEQLIFDGFSLLVPSGTTMALVGESGSGKSTVVSLVERFYDPNAGEVLIDGVNLKNLRLKWIRQQIGLVGQEPVLFATTIRENIIYGKEGATEEEIRTAIELANAAKFIDKMPDGLDTMVGEHGTQLSGGQKQRIAISRAILKNPKILLLDEATSALDAESERIVQDALERIMGSRTTIIVAHRLSTVQNADSISVVHRGKLVEQGSHEDLIKDPEGAYSQLVRLQEKNKHAEDAPPAFVSRTSDGTKSLGTSGSARSSIRKSISRGSSGRSAVMQYGSPSTSSFKGGDLGGDEENGQRLDTEDDKLHKPVPISRLARLNKPEVSVLLLGTAAACVNGAILPVSGILLSSVIKMFYEPPHELREHSKFWAIIYLVLGLVSFVVLPLQHFFFGVAGAKLIRRIRSLSFEKVVHQEISWFDEPANSSGSIGARLSSDASTVRSLLGDSLALIVQSLATVVAGFVIAFFANWKLSLVILAPLPLIGLQGYFQMKNTKGFGADAKAMYEEASQVANDAVSSIRTVASFCAEEKIMDTYERKCEAPVKDGVRRGVTSGVGFGVSFLVLYCTYALCFYVGARLVRDGIATFGQVFRVFFALTMAATSISQTSTMGPDANKARDSTASIFAIIDRKSKVDSSNDDGTVLPRIRGEITLKHVSFRYPTRPNVQIFKDLCLHVPSGKTVALVGESGSGKSTVIALLERFYDPDSGTILLDGVEVQRLNVRWLRQQMGLVSQEPALFNDTIRANIAYGKQGDVSEEEIVAAATAANAHQFISGLPQGYETNVGERGVQMSGGQKQRIAIARAILKDPRLLLLDEATSALDAESERVVQEALDRVMIGRTTVVVAHRLSTIKGADIIAVVKNGVIAEQGKHEELMEIANGAYSSLVALHSAAK